MSDSEDEGSEKQFKLVLLGEPQTGKTSICQRYTSSQFSKQYHPTTGVDFYLKRTKLPGSKNIALKLWDVSSTSLSGRMLDKYVFGADAIMLVYDVTSASSFENLKEWLEQSKKILAGQEKKPSFALVANKIDLEHLRAIKSDRHHKFAQDHGLLTYALSAKTGEGVVLCVQKIAADLLGIRLTKQEQEQHGAVVKAEIVQYKQEAALPRNPQTSTASAVCAVM
ncbi:ras-related protein Rab-28 [Eurytemora carolleeae]|uniref:ras-related protein Rab-28 n=1 Tax=Eurytemora carolleeae TaxID=1294199 RepID=UPI000C758779|nr:ras-related protein Rab-28 [Eurytemora carolleeae]|eukprot:XP_023346886.1 ras-related protein Rab-28-like [Eurytemora affinis]